MIAVETMSAKAPNRVIQPTEVILNDTLLIIPHRGRTTSFSIKWHKRKIEPMHYKVTVPKGSSASVIYINRVELLIWKGGEIEIYPLGIPNSTQRWLESRNYAIFDDANSSTELDNLLCGGY